MKNSESWSTRAKFRNMRRKQKPRKKLRHIDEMKEMRNLQVSIAKT